MPTNTFSKADWVSMETLRLLKHKRQVLSFFNTDYEREFNKEYPIGSKVRIKYPWQPLIRDGLAYAPQGIERLETDLTIDQYFGVDFEWDTIDKLLNMERGEERVKTEYLEKAATYLSAEADLRAAKFAAQNANRIVGALQTNPTTFDSTSAAARQQLAELDCPMTGKMGLLVPPAVMRSIKATNFTTFNPSDEISRMYKKGIVGMADGFEWSESMSLYLHTAGTWAGAVTLSAAPANGATSLAVTCTTGDTFKTGDKIGFAAVYPVNPLTRKRTQSTNPSTVSVKQDVTGVANAATIEINETLYFTGSYQNIDAQPANGSALTLFPGTVAPSAKAGKMGLALHRDAFSWACPRLPMPKPGTKEMVSQAYDDETGMSVSFIRDFDTRTRTWINRFDVGMGFGRLWASNCCVVVLCA